MRQLFKKYEKKLKLWNITRRSVLHDGTTKRVTAEDRKFKIPISPQQEVTLKWYITIPSTEGGVSQHYTVKHTVRNDKRTKIPKRMYTMKRQFQMRRDGHIAFADAVFQPEKKPAKPFFEYHVSTDPELSEKELRQMEEYQTFFGDWDDGDLNEEDCIDIMTQAVNRRVEVYQDVYKDTSNLVYLAKAVFLKFLDFNRLSELHKIYLMLAGECGLPMCYVEGILRRHYE